MLSNLSQSFSGIAGNRTQPLSKPPESLNFKKGIQATGNSLCLVSDLLTTC